MSRRRRFPREANATVFLAEGHDYRILATDRFVDDAVGFALISAPQHKRLQFGPRQGKVGGGWNSFGA
jgi:hypothetical protein